MFFINVYAPTDYREQENFIRTLSEAISLFVICLRKTVVFLIELLSKNSD